MPRLPRALLIDGAPDRVRDLDERLQKRGIGARRVELRGSHRLSVDEADLAVVVLDPSEAAPSEERLVGVLGELVQAGLATVVWGVDGNCGDAGGPLVEWLSSDTPLDEIVGKVSTLTRYAPLLRAMERELRHLHRLGEQLNRHFGELDQELRLASRMQRDFLPRVLPEVPGYKFATMYRPASWVSGDMYDVFRIDEHRYGLFIADAMGHGLSAGLLTMFLRQALLPKRVGENSYEIVRPSVVLETLHTSLVRQKLPNCQFVTAAYALLDVRSGEVTMARGGHPYALHVHRDGELEEVISSGSLLGLADVPMDFEEVRFVLGPGDKLVFYTDGLEETILLPRNDERDETVFTTGFQELLRERAGEVIQQLEEQLDHQEGSLNQADDVTMLAVEVGV